MIGTSYENLNKVLKQFLASETFYNRGGTANGTGPVPMDVSAIKGSCYYCGKPGHTAAECWAKSKGKAKEKNGKGKEKGKCKSFLPADKAVEKERHGKAEESLEAMEEE